MTRGLIGRKLGMSHLYSESGDIVPVTIIEVGPCSVSQVKTIDKDGYSAVQLAFGDTKEQRLNKAAKTHLSNANVGPKKYLKEFKFEGDAPELGATLGVGDVFTLTDKVKITGVTKGKGFQGVVKRHGHHGGPQAHGSRFHKHPGSIGSNTTPARVFKGVKLPGRDGGLKVSVQRLKIMKILPEENILLVAGSVPGPMESIVTIEKVK